jgi:hypothetical protein
MKLDEPLAPLKLASTLRASAMQPLTQQIVEHLIQNEWKRTHKRY